MDKQKYNRYHIRYNTENVCRISLNLHRENDKDIIEAIERAGSGNKQAGVKSLIRKALSE